jgi:hypothetical protein
MATCPECGKNSRDTDKPITIEQKLIVGSPLGAPRLGGEQFIARTKWVLSCVCGWYVHGTVREGSFWADGKQPEARGFLGERIGE